MGEKAGKVVVDTYAFLAMVYDELTDVAKDVMLDIYRGKIRGVVPSTVGYEFALHWLRGRIPGLKSLDEVGLFLQAYFEIAELKIRDFVEIASIKSRGDKLLAESKDPSISSRRLSLVDASVIHVALKHNAPVVSGDRDLRYVAKEFNIRVLW